RAEALDRDALHERLRGQRAQLRREAQHDRVVDARALEELQSVLEAGQRLRRAPEQHALRVAPEGDDHGLELARVRDGAVALEDPLMAEVDAVEDPDRDHRSARIRRGPTDAEGRPHGASARAGGGALVAGDELLE